jgi:IS5 family transposase
VRLAGALEVRTSFQRFCSTSWHQSAQLVRRGLDQVLSWVITRQLEAKGVMVRTGALVDPTLVASAGI